MQTYLSEGEGFVSPAAHDSTMGFQTIGRHDKVRDGPAEVGCDGERGLSKSRLTMPCRHGWVDGRIDGWDEMAERVRGKFGGQQLFANNSTAVQKRAVQRGSGQGNRGPARSLPTKYLLQNICVCVCVAVAVWVAPSQTRRRQ